MTAIATTRAGDNPYLRRPRAWQLFLAFLALAPVTITATSGTNLPPWTVPVTAAAVLAAFLARAVTDRRAEWRWQYQQLMAGAEHVVAAQPGHGRLARAWRAWLRTTTPVVAAISTVVVLGLRSATLIALVAAVAAPAVLPTVSELIAAIFLG